MPPTAESSLSLLSPQALQLAQGSRQPGVAQVLESNQNHIFSQNTVNRTTLFIYYMYNEKET